MQLRIAAESVPGKQYKSELEARPETGVRQVRAGR